MVGILLVSQGPLAQGMYETANQLYAKEAPSFDYLTYDPKTYQKDLLRKIFELNDGDGVIILSDILGEAPTNYASLLLDKGLHVVTGMNLSLVMYLLKNRENEGIDFETICTAGKDGITHLNQILVLIPDVQYGS